LDPYYRHNRQEYAELRLVYFGMPDESFNPYASPSVGSPSSPERVRGYGRMSESNFKAATRLMIACEVTFPLGWLLIIAGMLIPMIGAPKAWC
jgi:hypothetical protein